MALSLRQSVTSWRGVKADDQAVQCRNYFYNRHLSMCTWKKQDPHGQVLSQVGMIVETNENIDSNLAENGHEGAVLKGTQIEILHVGEIDDAGYLYGEACATKHRLWLSFTCIREAGCQCPLDLEDVAAPPPLPAIEHRASPSLYPILTRAPLAFAQWKDRRIPTTLADSTLFLHGEKHVCVHDKDGQPLGDIVGKYGDCFSIGTFEGVIQNIIDDVSDNFSRFELHTCPPETVTRSMHCPSTRQHNQKSLGGLIG